MNSEKKIEEIVRLMQRDDSMDAPQESVKWAKNLFRGRIAESGTSFVRRVIAVLQMDLSGKWVVPATGYSLAKYQSAIEVLLRSRLAIGTIFLGEPATGLFATLICPATTVALTAKRCLLVCLNRD